LAALAPGATTGIALVWLVQNMPETLEPAPSPAPRPRARKNACPHCGEPVPARAEVCSHCGEWLVDVPAEERVDDGRQGLPRSTYWLLGLGALVSFPLPAAAVVSRMVACGPTHSSTVSLGLVALVFCIPCAALPAVLARLAGRGRPNGEAGGAGDSSLRREAVGVIAGLVASLALSGCCAHTVFFPECL
jgi:hypothetical protein